MKLKIKVLWMITFLSPFFVFSQSVPDLEDLIQASIANDGNLNQQNYNIKSLNSAMSV